jgi:hypothetical protein
MSATFPPTCRKNPSMRSQGTEGKQKNKLGYQHAGILSRVTFSFVEPLIRLGVCKQMEERTSNDFLPAVDTAEKLSADFEAAYAEVQVGSSSWESGGRLVKCLVFKLLQAVSAFTLALELPVRLLPVFHRLLSSYDVHAKAAWLTLRQHHHKPCPSTCSCAAGLGRL